MKNRLFPVLATTAILALAAVSSAQGHGRRDGGGGPSHSRMERGDSRRSSGGDRSSGDRSSRDDRSTRDDRVRDDRSRDDRGRDDRVGGDRGRDDRVGGDRTSPFDRSVGRGGRLGYDRPSLRYDGRGHVDRVHFGAPPIHSALGLQVRRSAPRSGVDIAVGGVFGGLRVGYVSYGGGYRHGYLAADFGFGYPYYAYDPYAAGVVVVASPWYRYSYLPPYIDHRHVIVVDDYPSTWDWDNWRVYDYDRDRDNLAVRDAVDDLRDAFEERSHRIADRLVPESGDVAIFNDGKYDYSLNPDDFQKMFLDGVEQSKTQHYDILEVRTRGDEIRIRARHEYEDSWGDSQSVVHRITLRRENGGDYVIREFGTE